MDVFIEECPYFKGVLIGRFHLSGVAHTIIIIIIIARAHNN